MNNNETQHAYDKSMIRLAHVESLLSLCTDEIRATPVIVGDAELTKLRTLVREASTIAMKLRHAAETHVYG